MGRGIVVSCMGFMCCVLAVTSVWAEESVQVLTSQAMEECQKGRRARIPTFGVGILTGGEPSLKKPWL